MGTRKGYFFAALIACTINCGSVKAQAPSPGNGSWTPLGGEYYSGDTWVWRAHYDYCCGWTYTKLYPVNQLPSKADPDFWTKMAELNAHADEEQQRADYVKSRWPGATTAASYATTGFSVYQQGFAPQIVQGGTSLIASGQPINAAITDTASLIQGAQRLADNLRGDTQTAIQGANALVSQAVDGNSKAAQILAAGQIAAEQIRAANPPTTTVTGWQRTAQQQPAQVSAGANAVAQLSHGLLMQNCSKCHNAQKQSGGLDLTQDVSSLAAHRDDIEQKIRTGKMPKNGQPLDEASIEGMLAGIPKQSAPPQNLPPDVPPPPPDVPPSN